MVLVAQLLRRHAGVNSGQGTEGRPMLRRILGEVLVGLLAAGMVMALAVPATMQLGYEPGPGLAWGAVAVSVAGCIVIGERLNRRKKSRHSP